MNSTQCAFFYDIFLLVFKDPYKTKNGRKFSKKNIEKINETQIKKSKIKQKEK